jgi:hypothetical protein
MALQKIFLLPPLKGLNLYDNPFTMSPDYAVELVNFMPPTTTFSVRPGKEYILTIEGQVKGLSSYIVGSSIDYGKYWYNMTIKYGRASLLITKVTDIKNQSSFIGIDLTNNSTLFLGTCENSDYNDDSALFRHTLFFTSGNNKSTMNLYHQQKGIKNFALMIGQDGHQEIGNIQNITIFKNHLFLSSKESLNVYFIDTKYADILDPINSAFWRAVENIFSPHFGASFSLEGIVQKGGQIIKLTGISKSGADKINSYLVIITTEGEIVLYDGTDPTDTTGQKWIVAGRFEIPPPINRFCFVEMEGDLIVVTRNGLVSLKRVIFGQSSQITENLEYRLLSLFSQYMFTLPSFSQFISLYYHPRNRLLMLNIPTQLPIEFSQIVVSYIFNKNTRLTFAPKFNDINQDILDFIKNIILKENVNYEKIIEFNGDVNNSYIKFTVNTSLEGLVGHVTVDCGVKLNASTDYFSFLLTPAKYTIVNISLPNSQINVVTEFNFNPSLVDPKSGAIVYSFNLSDNEELVVTNLLTKSDRFFIRNQKYSLADLIGGQSLRSFESFTVKNTLNVGNIGNYLNNPNYQYQDIKDGEDIGFKIYRNSPLVDVWYESGKQLSMSKIIFRALQSKTADLSKLLVDEKTVEKLHFYILATLKCGTTSYTIKLNCIISTIRYGQTGGNSIYWIEYSSELQLNPTTIISWKYVPTDVGKNLYIHSECIWSAFGTSGTLIMKGMHVPPTLYTVTFSNSPYTDPISIPLEDSYFIYDGDIHWTDATLPPYSAKIKEGIIGVVSSLGGIVWQNSSSWLFSNIELHPRENVPEAWVPFSTLNNIPLVNIPIFNKISITCDFASIQYVFDSHFGTWSSFKNLNMIKGIEHDNDFYFITPNDIKNTGEGFITTTSSLYRFNESLLGDKVTQEETVPISVRYKTVDTFDFGVPNKKYLKRIKLFGTPSAFWQPKLFSSQKFPINITPYSDFKEGQTVSFVHTFDSLSVSQKALRKFLISAKINKEVSQEQTYAAIAELSFVDKNKFWEMYASENDMISQVSFPLIAHAGTRFGLEMNMEMREAYVDIYGFEIYFESSNAISL